MNHLDFPRIREMGILILTILCLNYIIPLSSIAAPLHRRQKAAGKTVSQRVIQVKEGPESVIWAVQLSDLHFSVHHPDRALDFKKIIAPTLQMINPSLVLITGDLTDGKSEDLLTMKQNEDEWLEYENVMKDVVRRSGLDKEIFYDLRGNHDNFGVPAVGGTYDFFSRHSINGQLGRRDNINSVTVETQDHKHLFVGLDTTASVGLRGPTNLFGHPTDNLFAQMDSHLSQWDHLSNKPLTKILFGHFPLSFSASSHSGKNLKDVFLNHSASTYLCGHLHSRFGKNLKRHHHQSSRNLLSSQKFFQFNIHQMSSGGTNNCPPGGPLPEFWEWEMGDWRKSRAMRVLAIDRGLVSYLDVDFSSGAKKTIVVPTFPLDSRTMSTNSGHESYRCLNMNPAPYQTVRALVFSVSPVLSVTARVYDRSPGTLNLVMETPMIKVSEEVSRGDFYAAPWNHKAFEDPSPDRFWLQIEVIDIKGSSTLTELRPFSIDGLGAKISWTWKEFFVMGCQWSALYYPIFWSAVYAFLCILLIPKLLLLFPRTQYSYKSFTAEKRYINGIFWALQELCRVPILWYGIVAYLLYLLLCPWFIGHVSTDVQETGYMTYMGWVVRSLKDVKAHEYIGSPDVMVIVLPHLFFVVFPAIFVSMAMAAERGVFKEHFLSQSGKKEEDDYRKSTKNSNINDRTRLKFCSGKRWIRKVLFAVSLAICWKHVMSCRTMMKAYDMNPLFHFPVYSFGIPFLLAYTAYKTRTIR
ncbi:putative metallophosphoesterase At3g03305 [Euphorbia lathyris]|uniref:putative metallophosphoesterase At3g03305 n=1 Tax=Euphorbia lathyris TaxID=212925 RepID=UPI003313FC99